MPVELYYSKLYLRRNELVLRHRTMVIREELFTCIHVCLHVIQQKWIKRINNDFPCISFLQNSCHSSFSMKLKAGKIFFTLYL